MTSKESFNKVIEKLNKLYPDLIISNKEQREETFMENYFLNLSGLNISSLPVDFFDELPELKHLSLSENQFSGFEDDLFKPLTKLVSLDLSFSLEPSAVDHDKSISLPGELFASQSHLILLDLSGNQLEVLPEEIFDGLFNLEALNLSYNLLALLPTSIGSCINLEELYTEGNFLPIEFKEAYTDYLELQDFLAPFNKAWKGMNAFVDMKGDEPNFVEGMFIETDGSEAEPILKSELEKAFKQFDDI